MKMTTQHPESNISTLLELPVRAPLPESAVNLILSSPPFIPVPHALNLRTFSSPGLLPPNKLFRSGSLSHIPAPILSTLSSTHNIKTIFDLRSRKEREQGPSPSIDSIETIWIPSTADIDGVGLPTHDGEAKTKSFKDVLTDVNPSDFIEKNGALGFIKIYGNILGTHRDAFKVFFEKLRDGSAGGILFHCAAGRDRTGVLAAMVLALVGAPDEIIARDYELTRIGVDPFREYLLGPLLKQMGKTDIEAFEEPGIDEMFGVRGQNILAFLEWMNGKWGDSEDKADVDGGNGKYFGVEGYLIEELGFKSEEMRKIRSNLEVWKS